MPHLRPANCAHHVELGGLPPLAPAAASGPVVPEKTSGLAIASLIFGLLFLFFPLSIVAIVFGHISLSQIKKSAGRLGGKGLAIAGLVLGYLGIAMIPLILIIAAIAIPNLLRARIAANEASAVSAVRRISAAQVTYQSQFPTRRICSRPAVSGRCCAMQRQPGHSLPHRERAGGCDRSAREEWLHFRHEAFR